MPRVIDPNVHFDGEMAVRYDAFVPRLVPDYERLHEHVVAQLGLALDEGARVLVVGAGTCTEVLALADFDDTWAFTAVEPSAPMVDVARQHMADAGLSDRVTFHTGTLDTLDDQGPFDAATAILMMQFVAADDKAAVFKDIGKRLNSGAPLVMVHPIGDPHADEHTLAMQAWRDHIEESLPDRAEDVFATVQDTLHFVFEDSQAEALAAAGFAPPQRFHSRMVFGAWVAKKT
jgi:tRNA (cmo5U34)-methyltransferase